MDCRKRAATGKQPCRERLAKAECANDKHIPLWLWRDEAALQAVQMSGFRDRLSVEEKKRITIATVLSMNPQILVLDEPSAELDPRARRTLINLLHELPITMLVSTHDMKLVEELFPRTIVMDEGVIVADRKTQEILADAKLLEAHGLEKL